MVKTEKSTDLCNKLSRFFVEMRRPANLIIFSGNILFIFIWGYFGWGKFSHWSRWYFDFDSAGHFLFGFSWGFILLYWIRVYLPEHYVNLPRGMTAFIIISIVGTLEDKIWENIEWLWDGVLQPMYPYLDKAQKSINDTNLDMMVTTMGAVMAMLAWAAYRKWYAYKWPDKAEKEEIDEEKERGKIWARALLARRKEHQKQILKVFFGSIRVKLKERRAKNADKKINPDKD